MTTVSRALKEGPEVHPRTRARVQKAAAKAGYTPNIHGLALRTGRTRTIAAILPLETRAYVADLAKVPLIEGMTLAASENGYALSIFSTGPEEDQLWSLQRLVQSGISDGIIITRWQRMIRGSPSLKNEASLRRIRSLGDKAGLRLCRRRQ
ncbi:LacI family DNA-binding transcriptional regulator [Mesorhizobium sp. CA4]|uniref:LacI family DNA-binding transcriptional regulator n=1 Tax=Mesorhizobium sp. CA4 TaxID=588499 RepID=UPI001CD0A588|nr:LacI family DNA-binding transcriptional regulator [Mesorhizobium sp. CA4]MBZ9822224.1 LacI family transcriptional regulator [Mesorhizobium sp. CA4]